MASTRTGSKRLLRDLNQSIVFNLIAEEQAISRTKLAKKSGLPAATITRIVANFISAGLVLEVQSETSSGGRRPVLLSINPSSGYAVGVKLRENGMTITLCDLSCTILCASEQTFTGGSPPYQVVDLMASAIKQMISEAGLTFRQVLGVGIGLAGFVDSTHGICRYSSLFDWRDAELGPALEFKLRVPVSVDNDVNTLAVAERLFGAGHDIDNFLLITTGRGVGMGVIINGEIYRGSHGGAGEFGHMTVDTRVDAPSCTCGKRGCLEAVASDYGILRAATGGDPGYYERSALDDLVERAVAGDIAIQKIFRRAGEALGIATANLINIFDPERILITGEGLRAGELLLEPLRMTIPLHTFGVQKNVELVITPVDETTWARGAASLILRKVFQSPIYEEGDAHAIDDLLLQATQMQQLRRKTNQSQTR
ncbi:ROK family transcriptional regulator [Ktedonospora formicarum]|uniref:Xylose repressor protein n=1 Tax=Ktedonospora formicarum TaxID=2778364 RepID=A0A8J3MUL3_9CHLR|nr:ROK family transcriptional regulator [Ktedonospora formicarum]GHO46738.1 xylose repressor protein [Ktedonospora formicarum]